MPSTYTVTYKLTRCTSTNTETSVIPNTIYRTTLQKPEGTDFTVLRVTSSGVDVTAQVWNPSTQEIVLTVTGDIVITANTLEVCHINLYQNQAEPRRVNKVMYLYSNVEIAGVFRDNTSLTHPSFIVDTSDIDVNLLTYNYVYIQEFNRYYFIDEIVVVRHNLIRINCRVDVLMTYHEGITDLTGFVERNEYDYNDYLVDSERLVENKPNITVIESTTIFSTTNVETVLLNYYK